MVKYTWTKNRILESLDGFSDFEVWASQHPSAYDVALNKGLIEKIKVVLNN